MSLFRSEHVWSKRLHLEQNSSPVQKVEGQVWNDIQQKCVQSVINGVTGSSIVVPSVNITPVTATNPSTEADLQTYAIPAGAMNVVGKTIEFASYGTFTTAGGQTPTLRLRAYIGTIAILDYTSAASTASSTTFPWNINGLITTSAVGASGTVEAHGIFRITVGASIAGAATAFNDQISAASSAIDLTAAQTFKLTALLSSANAGNNVISRHQVIKLAN